MRYIPVAAGELVTAAQRLVIISALALAQKSQSDLAVESSLNRADLNRVINGRLVPSQKYAEALNGLVYGAHPVQLAV